jgi:myo-inositol-1(or 4)-monophosphatase
VSSPDELRALAVEVAREAGMLAAARRRQGVRVAATKTALADIVTDADREVEALIRERLAAARPGDAFLGEETGSHAGSTPITWVVDPIDGTVNYAYDIPAYAVSIAAVAGPPEPSSWSVLAGAVFNPAVGEMFHAARGEGSWRDHTRIRVTSEVPAAGALVATGFGYDPETHAGDLARLAHVMPLARDIRRMGAASLDLAGVAAGRLDGYYERGLHPWDIAAGVILVEEAQGTVGGVNGAAPGVAMTIAAGPALFAELAAAVARQPR